MSAACLCVIKKLRVFRVFKVFREKNNQLTRAATLIALTQKILTMKKSYFQPATEVAEVVTVSRVLMASGGGDPAPAPGVKANRTGYGEGTTTW